jgi:hypothetical protein
MGGAASQRGKDKRPRRTEGYRQATSARADEIAFRESDRPNPPTAGDTYGDGSYPALASQPALPPALESSHAGVRQSRG